MLLKFSVGNYRSFRDEVELSAVATRLDKGIGFPTQIAQDGSTVDILPVVGILGANASGKSNLIRAMSTMRDLVLNSGSRPPYMGVATDPFRLDPLSSRRPTTMSIDFAYNGARYQYGFEIGGGRVIEEWLHTFPHKRVQVLFDREKTSEYQFGKNLGGRNRTIEEITRPQSLFLSTAASAGHPLLSDIYAFFVANLSLLDVHNRISSETDVATRLGAYRDQAVRLLAMADLGITDLRIRKGGRREDAEERERSLRSMIEGVEFPAEMTPEERSEQIDLLVAQMTEEPPTLELHHRGLHKNATALSFEDESLGTRSWLSFILSALEALDKGRILLVDELDVSLHPILLAEALRMFQSRKSNRHGAQLIFTTHDVTLLGGQNLDLDRYRLSRGQVWLTEKEANGSSTLTPLAEYRPRKGEDLTKGYMQGRYGGTPRVSSVSRSNIFEASDEA